MIQQFINELMKLEKISYWPFLSTAKDFKEILGIFYDYCLDTDNTLNIAIKYMIDNNKRPGNYEGDKFFWNFVWNNNFYWHLPKDLYLKMYQNTNKNVNNYLTLLEDLARGLNDSTICK